MLNLKLILPITLVKLHVEDKCKEMQKEKLNF